MKKENRHHPGKGWGGNTVSLVIGSNNQYRRPAAPVNDPADFKRQTAQLVPTLPTVGTLPDRAAIVAKRFIVWAAVAAILPPAAATWLLTKFGLADK